ncbi:MAG: GerMN domain-containing protein [Fusobacteriaceae bacterium]|jgi:hypothetical protein|nr:GerMN domain-containing protein [Fusobacteriaceae bacterium]
MNTRDFKRLTFYIIVWLAFVATGFVYLTSRGAADVRSVRGITKKENPLRTEKITVYAPTKDRRALEKITLEIPQSESRRDKIRTIVAKDLETLAGKGFLPTNKITPLNVYITEDNTVYVDFNLSVSELEAETEASNLVISSLVNSICELPDINKIKFMVNGKDGKKNLAKFYRK